MKKPFRFILSLPLAASGLLLATAASHAGLALPPAAGDALYVSDFTTNTIHEFTSTGVSLGVFATGVSGNGMAFDSSGNLYVATGSSTIEKVTPAGSTSVFATLPGGAGSWNLAFDSTGNLYVSEFAATVEKFSSTGTDLGAYNTNSYGVTGLAFDSAGNLYEGANGAGVFKVTPGDASNTEVENTGGLPRGLAFDLSGNLYLNLQNNNTVEEFANTGGGVLSSSGTIFASGATNSHNLAFDSSGDLYVVGNSGGIVQEFSSTGTSLGTFASIGSDNTYAIAFAPEEIPTPEPSTWLSIIGGLGLLAGFRRFGRTRAA
jgi:sugar lactone lactonase YvrE